VHIEGSVDTGDNGEVLGGTGEVLGGTEILGETYAHSEGSMQDTDAALLPTPEASQHASSAQPYLGIDMAEVLNELQSLPLSATEPESIGSDSDPSMDNMGQEELAQITRMLRDRRPLNSRKQARGKRKTADGDGQANVDNETQQPAERTLRHACRTLALRLLARNGVNKTCRK